MRCVGALEDDPRIDDGDLRNTSAPTGTAIVVGGHSRGVGKTTTIEQILREQPWGRWTAVKVSAHRHCQLHETKPLIEQDLIADPRTQTGRYLLAGAARAFLCRTPATLLPDAAAFVRALLADGSNVLVESNRIVDVLEPDVVLFAVAPRIADWKASSGVALPRTHAFVIYDDSEREARDAVRALAARGRMGFALGHGDEAARFQRWLAGRLPTVPDGQRAHASIN